MDRGRLVEEILLLLPVLGRGIGRPTAVEIDEISSRGLPADVHLAPGHVQVLIALSQGPRSVSHLAEAVDVSRPAATQLVDRLAEHGMVERRHDETDRRVVLVDYAPGMKDIASRMMEGRRSKLEKAMQEMTDEEVQAFLKGLRLLVGSFEEGEV